MVQAWFTNHPETTEQPIKKSPPFTVTKPNIKSRASTPWQCRWREIVEDGNGVRKIARKRFFKTEEEAIAYGEQVTHPLFNPDPVELDQVQMRIHKNALLRCKEKGVSLEDVLNAGFKAMDVGEICNFDLQEIAGRFEYACSKRVKRDTLRKDTANGYKYATSRLMETLGKETRFGSILPEQVVQAIATFSPSLESKRDYIRSIRPLFTWAAEQGYYTKERARAIRLPMLDRQELRIANKRRTITIFTNDQVQKVFNKVEKKYHPGLALLFFAGIRPGGELSKLRWWHEDDGHWYGINFETREIKLHHSWCKKGQERLIQNLPPIIWYYLEQTDNKTGTVAGVQYKAWKQNVYEPGKTELGIDEWPRDVTRHTFASNLYQVQGVEAAIDALGHADYKMLEKHYKASRTREQAEAYFQIRPEDPEDGKIVPLGKKIA